MNNNVSLMDYIFDSELKNYTLLEKTVFEAFEMYKETSNDRIKYIVNQNITVAKNQIFIMLEILSQCADYKLKKSYEEKLNIKLLDMKEIERTINGFTK